MLGDFLSPYSFRMPEWLVASAWTEHAPFAAWLIEAHRPRTFVELGSHRGYSYAAFCEAVRRTGLDTRCSAVDTWRGDEHAGFYGDDVFRRLAAFHDTRYAAFSRLIRATFDEAVAEFADGSIDLLHIDGRHFYDDVRHDFETWRPKLSERAVVLFHDTAVRERDFGVYRLWAELRAASPSFEFLHGHGLGVLGLGPEQTDAMRMLYAASADAATTAEIRDAYAFLGRAIGDRYDLQLAAVRTQRALAERDAEISRLRALNPAPNPIPGRTVSR